MITSFVIHGSKVTGEIIKLKTGLWFRPTNPQREAIPLDLVAETIGREKGLIVETKNKIQYGEKVSVGPGKVYIRMA